jgi:ABC-type transport system substrate-binding protein
VTDSTIDEQFYEAFARDMGDLGLVVRPNPVTWQEMMRRIDKAEAQIWGISWGADYPDAQNFLQLFYGPNAPTPNGANYRDPEYDRIYEESLALPSGERRTEAYRRLQRIVTDECVWIFRGRRVQWELNQAWFHNFKYDDLYLKYFKYCRSDVALRRQSTERWNEPKPWPVVGIVLAFAALFGLTAVATRNTVTGW